LAIPEAVIIQDKKKGKNLNVALPQPGAIGRKRRRALGVIERKKGAHI